MVFLRVLLEQFQVRSCVLEERELFELLDIIGYLFEGFSFIQLLLNLSLNLSQLFSLLEGCSLFKILSQEAPVFFEQCCDVAGALSFADSLDDGMDLGPYSVFLLLI